MSQESIDADENMLLDLEKQLRKASERKSVRRIRRIRIERDSAAVFVRKVEGFIVRRLPIPRGVSKLYRRARLRLQLKPGPRRRSEPRQAIEIDPNNLTGMQKAYRRRAKWEAELNAMLERGETFLSGPTQYAEFKRKNKLP